MYQNAVVLRSLPVPIGDWPAVLICRWSRITRSAVAAAWALLCRLTAPATMRTKQSACLDGLP